MDNRKFDCMTKSEAIRTRDKLREQLCGQQFDGKKGWDIQDVIVASTQNVRYLYHKMYDVDVTNEVALSFFPDAEDDYDVYVISHQWPWGSGDLLFERTESYLRHNTLFG